MTNFATQGGSQHGPFVTPGGGPDPTQPQALDTGEIWGLATNWLTGSTVNIEPGRARNIADDFDLTLAATSVIDFTTNGLGGLDVGAQAADTWYYGWVVGDSTGVNPTGVIASLQSTFAGLLPNLPAGYDRGRRVASYRSNPLNNIREFYQQTRTGATRRFAWDNQTYSNMQVLSSYSTAAFITVNLQGFVPPTTVMSWLNFRGTSDSGIDSKCYFRPNGAGTGIGIITQGELFGADSGYIWQRTDANQQIEAAVGSTLSDLDLAVLGYDDPLVQ